MLEAHAHNFLLTGISPEKLGDPGLGNCLYEYNCRRSPGCTKQVLQVCAGVSRALSGLLDHQHSGCGTESMLADAQNNPVVSCQEWGPGRKSNPQADLPTLVDIYGPVYTLFTSPVHGECFEKLKEKWNLAF